MGDRREEILNSEHQKLIDDRGFPRDGGELVFVHRPAAICAMDEYLKETCLHLLEYMATLEVECYIDDKGEHVFYMRNSKRDIILTKEQLFENFL